MPTNHIFAINIANKELHYCGKFAYNNSTNNNSNPNSLTIDLHGNSAASVTYDFTPITDYGVILDKDDINSITKAIKSQENDADTAQIKAKRAKEIADLEVSNGGVRIYIRKNTTKYSKFKDKLKSQDITDGMHKIINTAYSVKVKIPTDKFNINSVSIKKINSLTYGNLSRLSIFYNTDNNNQFISEYYGAYKIYNGNLVQFTEYSDIDSSIYYLFNVYDEKYKDSSSSGGFACPCTII